MAAAAAIPGYGWAAPNPARPPPRIAALRDIGSLRRPVRGLVGACSCTAGAEIVLRLPRTSPLRHPRRDAGPSTSSTL